MSKHWTNPSAQFTDHLSAELGYEVSEEEAMDCKDKLMQFFSLLQQMEAAQKRKRNDNKGKDGSNRDRNSTN